jgi:DNA-binding transcriptional LysR family regulator
MHDPLARLPWDDLRFFLAAARAGSFGAAARVLSTDPSTVSRRLAGLETALGARLFDRSAAGLVLTQLGRLIAAEAEPMETAMLRVADLASREATDTAGLVRVAATETMASAFLIPHVLPELLAQHPGLRIDLVVGDGAVDLIRREADVAVRFFLSARGDLLTKRVATLETVVAARPSLARALRGTPPDRWPWIVAWLPSGPTPEEDFQRGLTAQAARLTMNSYQSQLAAVKAGLGVAVLPRALLADDLVAVPVAPSASPSGAKPKAALPARSPAPSLPTLPVYLATPRALRRVARVSAVFGALERAFGALAEAPPGHVAVRSPTIRTTRRGGPVRPSKR